MATAFLARGRLGPLPADPAIVAEFPPNLRSAWSIRRHCGRRLHSWNEACLELATEEPNQPRQSIDFDEEFHPLGRRQNLSVGLRRGLTNIDRHRGRRRRLRRNLDDADVDPFVRCPASSLMCFRCR